MSCWLQYTASYLGACLVNTLTQNTHRRYPSAPEYQHCAPLIILICISFLPPALYSVRAYLLYIPSHRLQSWDQKRLRKIGQHIHMLQRIKTIAFKLKSNNNSWKNLNGHKYNDYICLTCITKICVLYHQVMHQKLQRFPKAHI